MEAEAGACEDKNVSRLWLNSRIWMLSTILYTKCVKMKPVMVKASKDYITVISNNTVKFVNTIEGSAGRLLPF